MADSITKMLEKYLGKNWLWSILGTITIIIIMYAIFYFEAHDTSRTILDAAEIDMEIEGGSGGSGPGDQFETKIADQSFDGRSPPAVSNSVTIEEEMVQNVSFKLQWVDDEAAPGAGIRWTNNPDTMTITITTPWDETVEKSAANGNDGRGEITHKFSANDEDLAGEWKVEVNCDAGGFTSPLGLSPIVGDDDTGNDWNLVVEWEYYAENEA